MLACAAVIRRVLALFSFFIVFARTIECAETAFFFTYLFFSFPSVLSPGLRLRMRECARAPYLGAITEP